MEAPSKDEYLDWKSHPVTQYVMFLLTQEHDQEVENLVGGVSLAGNSSTAELTARIVGRIEGLKTLLKIQYDDIGE